MIKIGDTVRMPHHEKLPNPGVVQSIFCSESGRILCYVEDNDPTLQGEWCYEMELLELLT